MTPNGICVIIVGSELLSGKRKDGHLTFVIQALDKRGMELDRASYVGDTPKRLRIELERSFADGDLVFSFGGIGATPDDHTRQCAANALGVPLVRHPEAAQVIIERFGKDAFPQRIKMAELPEGCELIPNPVNRIAGFSIRDHHFVPGFPQMAWPMLEWVLDEHYFHLHTSDGPVESLLRLPGISEGVVAPMLLRFVEQYPTLRLSCLPHMDGDYRETELGVRGTAAEVAPAFEWLKLELEKMGLEYELSVIDVKHG